MLSGCYSVHTHHRDSCRPGAPTKARCGSNGPAADQSKTFERRSHEGRVVGAFVVEGENRRTSWSREQAGACVSGARGFCDLLASTPLTCCGGQRGASRILITGGVCKET